MSALTNRLRQPAMRLLYDQSKRNASHSNAATMKLWERLTYFVAFPSILLGMANVWFDETPHARPEFIPYEHLRIRTKKFPWGDGNHSFFHNPHVNALPDGYEDVGHDH